MQVNRYRSSSLSANGSSSIRSLASTLYCDIRFARRSAAKPCIQTAHIAAETGSIPCAASDAIIPASTSPLPPLASDALPVVLSHTVPLKYEPTEVFLEGLDQSKVDRTTEEWLDKIEDRLNYQKWYCGHYHTEKKVDKIEIMFENIKKFLE